MAQIIYHNFQEDLLSFDFNKAYAGLLHPSRYRGFDNITINPSGGGNLTFSIGHSLTGIKHTLADGVSQSNFTGVALTRQGMIVQENAQVISSNLVCITNAGNNNPRTDLIILEHQYNPVIGGQVAIYKVIQGALGDPTGTPPAIPNNKLQIVIGLITLTPNSTSITPINYQPSQVPLLGGSDLLTNYSFTFNKFLRKDIQDIKQSPFSIGQEIINVANIDAHGILIPAGTGNILLYTNADIATSTVEINGIRKLGGLGQKLTLINGSNKSTLKINIGINNSFTDSLIPATAYIGGKLAGYLNKTFISLEPQDTIEFTDSNGIWYVSSSPDFLGKGLSEVSGPWTLLNMLAYGNGDVTIDGSFSNAKSFFDKINVLYKRTGQTLDFAFIVNTKSNFPTNKNFIELLMPLSCGKASFIDWNSPTTCTAQNAPYNARTSSSGVNGMKLIISNPGIKLISGATLITAFGKIFSPVVATDNGNTLSTADNHFANS